MATDLMQITNFEEIRRDGKILGEDVGAAEFAKLGWKPDKTTELRWLFGDKRATISAKHGVWAHVVFGRRYVAALLSLTEKPFGKHKLLIFNGDGTLRHDVPDKAPTRSGLLWKIEWVSFETMVPPVEDEFGAIGDDGGGQWGYFVNADTGAIKLRGESR